MQKVSQESSVFIFLRTVLSAGGAYLLGSNIFGQTIDQNLWQEFTGIVMGMAAIVWSIKAKTIIIEQVQGFIRQLSTFVFMFLVPLGIVSDKLAVLIPAIVMAFMPMLQSYLSKVKARQIKDSDISINSLVSIKK